MAGDRFTRADPHDIARQLWAATHGIASLCPTTPSSRRTVLDDLATTSSGLYIGYGDDPASARCSISAALRHARRRPPG